MRHARIERTPDYEAPAWEYVDAALKAIDSLLDHCGLDAMDNTAAGLLHYVHARWDALRAERVVHGEAWANERYSLSELGGLMLELAHTEGLDLDTALDRAAEQLEALHGYEAAWDHDARRAQLHRCLNGEPHGAR